MLLLLTNTTGGKRVTSTLFSTRHVRPVVACLLVVGAWIPPAAAAQSATATFRLGSHHDARQELCFAVGSPGAIDVQVESEAAGELLNVTVYAGAAAVHSAQGEGRIAFRVPVTSEHLTSGEEWAVALTSTMRASTATGRIRVSFPERTGAGAHALDSWLRTRPAVAFHMTWNDAGRPAPYSAWPRGMPQRLWAIYDELRAGRPGPVADPPPNAWQVRAGEDPSALHTAFGADVAREMYLTAIAHSLLIDMERRVPWTLDDLNGDELDALLSSASMFWWNHNQQAYEISEFDHGWAVPASPVTAWTFLQQQRLLKSTRLDTVTAVVAWARDLTPFNGPVSRENFFEHWGYEGDMPVARALAGTRYSGTAFRSVSGLDLVRHYTAGCHGTVGLLLSVLRAANIPARPRTVSNDTFTHATILFLSEDLALSHGDDPYSPMMDGADPGDLLIDAATYDRWLGPLATDPGRNIGRQALTIGVQHLPAIVRRAHALDRQQGIAPEQSAVFAMFKGTFTMDELLTAALWERLDAALASTRPASAAATAGTSSDVWLEAEDLTTDVTAGIVEPQVMDGFTTGTWRNGRQLWWRDARPGASLFLPFTVPADGTYRLSIRFTRAPDYGIVSVRLDDRGAALDRVSLYAPVVLAADPLGMGEHELASGPHRLRFTIVGTHPDAIPAFMVGIDAVRLERLR
jgi:hypothetical protein